MELNKKVAIITGGSGGIGRSIAEIFAKNGAKVFIVDRKLSDLKKVAFNLRQRGLNIYFFKGDISKLPDIRRVVGNIFKSEKKIDLLVNCAGVQAPIGPFIGTNSKDWLRNLSVNLLGTVLMTKEVLPFMIKQKSGSIINFSGGGATSSRPNFSAYATSKIGVVKFTEILAEEVKEYSVRINAIAPGAVNTSMIKEILSAGKKSGDKEIRNVKQRFKEGFNPPELAARLALFLASRKSYNLTGRLISAEWDSWDKWNKKDIEEIMKSEKYLLRRVK